ncbi:protein-tyrosine-phosphatase [Christiangramia sp. OXR-203]|jgi:arsenate reductase|uniref:protein-tyrosine-phosphatase n=1 Tax=Christiangramia sp. OXR-203 TaxID=3100176 RepID=UPI002AC995D6|nr:protein-tyrosine-phosphatase [Christiangramia sp. OXR-203]WPY99562.1 protein-tyrosine-phosphatase [Christiangramia sp. OXR-203]
MNNIFPELTSKIKELEKLSISEERMKVLQPLVEFISNKINSKEALKLNFICTHNSRRSQLAQAWAMAASDYYEVPARCYSGGTEATAFFPQAISTLSTSGFRIDEKSGNNPKITVDTGVSSNTFYSKVFDDEKNPTKNFAAVMTCSHADENCPFIVGAESRIPLNYEDPKSFDDTVEMAEKYMERSDQIGSEMLYAFKKANSNG